MYLHHSLALALWPVPADHSLRLPARKRVECRSRDLHQSLLVKLNQARAQHNGPDISSSPAARKSALEAGGSVSHHVFLSSSCSRLGLQTWHLICHSPSSDP